MVTLLRVKAWLLAVVFTACGSQGGPTLTLTVTPQTVVGATPARLRVEAVNSDGTPGSGTVSLSAPAGQFPDGTTLPLDAYGTIMSIYTCDVATDAACTGAVAITASWRDVVATKSVSINPPRPACFTSRAASQATASNLSLFGDKVYFNNGQPVAAGTYRLSYVDGCMKYNNMQGWTVNAEVPNSSWTLRRGSDNTLLAHAPGHIGYRPGAAFAVFSDCVAASLRSTPPTFVLPAADTLYLVLADFPFSDNLPGEGGRNPQWELAELKPGCE